MDKIKPDSHTAINLANKARQLLENIENTQILSCDTLADDTKMLRIKDIHDQLEIIVKGK